jgi:hypothetical protein
VFVRLLSALASGSGLRDGVPRLPIWMQGESDLGPDEQGMEVVDVASERHNNHWLPPACPKSGSRHNAVHVPIPGIRVELWAGIGLRRAVLVIDDRHVDRAVLIARLYGGAYPVQGSGQVRRVHWPVGPRVVEGTPPKD